MIRTEREGLSNLNEGGYTIRMLFSSEGGIGEERENEKVSELESDWIW